MAWRARPFKALDDGIETVLVALDHFRELADIRRIDAVTSLDRLQHRLDAAALHAQRALFLCNVREFPFAFADLLSVLPFRRAEAHVTRAQAGSAQRKHELVMIGSGKRAEKLRAALEG